MHGYLSKAVLLKKKKKNAEGRGKKNAETKKAFSYQNIHTHLATKCIFAILQNGGTQSTR